MLAACNKDNDDIQPTQNGYSGPKRLASITGISYSKCYRVYTETGNHELSYTSGSKNIGTFRWSSEGLLLGMGMEGIASDLITMEYDGNKIKTVVINGAAMGASEDITYTCSYTGDNLTQLYASMPGQGWTMTTLTYSPNGELLTMREESSDGELTVTILLWDNGNVTHVEQSNSNSHSSNIYTYIFDYIYDNKASYCKGLEFCALIGTGNYYMLSKNNVLRAIDNYHPRSQDTTIYTYDYDGDWPITSKATVSIPYGLLSENTNYFSYTNGSGATVPQTFTISVTSNMSDNTNVHVSGGGEYEAGRQVVLSASCYQSDISFRCWNDGVTTNPRTITATEDAEYIAVFGATNEK